MLPGGCLLSHAHDSLLIPAQILGLEKAVSTLLLPGTVTLRFYKTFLSASEKWVRIGYP